MKNWKISKVRIESFKAFARIDLDFERKSLITLEGPNGYGKTSVFDASELIFTGSISRISELVDDLIDGRKKGYEDNLYWNTKGGTSPICLKVEFIDDDGASLTFARVASVADLQVAANNCANNFESFKLYRVANLDSVDFKDPLEANHLEEYFGTNFCHNYPMLNYFQQGENPFLFTKSTSDRKKALETLFNTTAIKAEIEFCGKLEKKLALHLSESERQKTTELASLVEKLSTASSNNGAQTFFAKLSTKNPVPTWDLEQPFTSIDPDLLNLCLNEVDKLQHLSANKIEVQTRLRNIDIEKFITDERTTLSLAVEIGKHYQRFEELSKQSARLARLDRIISLISRGPQQIKITDVPPIIEIYGDLDQSISELISERDILTTQISQNALKVEELLTAREKLRNIHKEVHEHSSQCPLCAFDWGTSAQLTYAIDQTTDALRKNADTFSKKLEELVSGISNFLSPATVALRDEKQDLLANFNADLYSSLVQHKVSFDAIEKVNLRLNELGIDYEPDFSSEPQELELRKHRLFENLRNLKEPETTSLPADWLASIRRAFAKRDDFYSLEKHRFEEKRVYLLSIYQDLQNSSLQKANAELSKRRLRESAYKRIKEKISKLKSTLTKAEKSYASRTIKEIELIFHIYSGRLIQNYQRGLGLFIDEGDGKKVQFCTAERSEHDATLSMSSGQLCALGLSFFLSLNRVYSKTPFILIDDPSQSLDEINIASLTDLLRSEFEDRQFILSSHEDDIAAYMRYRFQRAGLTQKRFHMQALVAEPEKSMT